MIKVRPIFILIIIAFIGSGCGDNQGTPTSQDAPQQNTAKTQTTTPNTTSTSVEQPGHPFVSSQVKEYFYEIALGNEYGVSNQVVRKWAKPQVSIGTRGSVSESDMQCLAEVISDFNSISKEMKLVLTSGNSDMTAYFVPEGDFETIEPNYEPLNYGYFWDLWGADYALTKATILISTTDITELERCHLLREEITQSTGLMNDSWKYPDSIFYGEWTTTTRYSDIDKQVIQILYGGNGIKPGTSKSLIDPQL